MVTVVIPMRNEEAYIADCLRSVIQNDYPADRYEILVVDGESKDASADVVAKFIRAMPDRVRLLKNPNRTQAHGLNLGIREARGQIIVRMDAHALYQPDYISICVDLLRRTGASNVGGIQYAQGRNLFTNAVADVVSSRFAAGDAKYRYVETNGDGLEVDTVYLGAWWKRTLEEFGGFNVEMNANQDYELNHRLRRGGGKILLNSRLKTIYFVRGNLPKLARQYFRYGFYKIKTLTAHPDSLKLRQLVAPAFVLALLGSLTGAVLGLPVAVTTFVPVLYICSSLAASCALASRKGWMRLPLYPLLFLTIHLSWGVGFWVSIGSMVFAKLRWPPQPSESTRTPGACE
jgi:glycosyltransferase involved in cell wall biosynthesis